MAIDARELAPGTPPSEEAQDTSAEAAFQAVDPEASADGAAPPTAPATPDPAELERRRRDDGRTIADLRRRLEAVAGTVAEKDETIQALNAKIDATIGRLNQREQQEQEAYLNALPPEQRTQAELKMLRERIDGLTAPTLVQQQPTRRAAPPTEETPQQYQQRRSRELLEQIEAETGVRLKGDEPGIDYSEQAPFYWSARAIAEQIAARGGQENVAKAKPSEKGGEQPGAGAASESERVQQQVARDLGVGRSNAAPARAPRASGPVTGDTYNEVLKGYDSKLGPRGMRKQLQEVRDRAAAKVPRA